MRGANGVRRALAAGALIVVAALSFAPGIALAGHWRDFAHDHSSEGVPYRPRGLTELMRRFGGPACNDEANDARTYFPSAVDRGVGGYVYYHPYLARNVGWNIRGHVNSRHQEGAIDYGVYGYNCRLMRGGTSYSTHAWGAAIDTNTARNPYGQTYWDGRGSDGWDYGRYLPDLYRGGYPGHRFYWGLRWNDPHHLQYVTGY